MKLRNFLPGFFLCGLLVTSLAACEREAEPQHATGPVPVTVVTLASQPVKLTRELPGRTRPYLIAEIRPQVSGIIKARLFDEGTLVRAGQPLYQLDDAIYQADFISAKASLARAESMLNSAQIVARRQTQLIKSNAVSRQDYDDAIAALQQAEAEIKVAEAAVQSSRIMLGYARINSPINGRAGKSSVTQGALVTANQAESLTTVQQLDPIYVDLAMSSSELLELRREVAAGDLERSTDVPVAILLENGWPYPHDGKLAFTDVTVNPSTGSFFLRVLVPNPDLLLMPGMYVRAVISGGQRPNGLLAPQKGITRDPKGNATALIAGADNKVELRQVQVSRTIGDQWLVDSGLKPGDKVIVEGLQKVQPGVPVQPSEAPPAAADPGATPDKEEPPAAVDSPGP